MKDWQISVLFYYPFLLLSLLDFLLSVNRLENLFKGGICVSASREIVNL